MHCCRIVNGIKNKKHKKQPWGKVEGFAFGGATVRFASLETSFHAANHTIPPPPSHEGLPRCPIEKALKEHIFSGAYIDVTDPEPLPKDNELWNLNNLIITPHVTGGYHLDETLNRIVQISATNIKNYCEGKKIINRVNLEV